VRTPAPERFGDLPAGLRDELRRAAARQADTRGVRVRARRSLGYAMAAFALMFLPGAGLVSLFVAPMAILNAVLALREARGVRELRAERGRAIAGLAVGAATLLWILGHIAHSVVAYEEIRRQLP
jgi:Flp pilus assembly protein TadB